MSAHGISLSRARLDLSSGWTFSRGRKGCRWLHSQAAVRGETVSLPHSWNRTDTFQSGVKYYQGSGNYCRDFVCPPTLRDRQVWLCSEGFYGTGTVWLNSRVVGRVNGQFLGFRVPVGHVLEHSRNNRIACCLTNRCGKRELPGIRHPDFLLHGGLAGRVWLEATSNCFLDDACFRVTTSAGESPRVDAGVRVVNAASQPVRASVVWSLCTHDGVRVAGQISASENIASGQSAEIESTLLAANVELWSEQIPRLYELRARLLIDETPVDTLHRRIGFRSAVFREGKGFFLNGKRVFLRGCNRHENMPGCGSALSVKQHRADAAAIRDMGLNFVRLSHYPQSPAFLDACDEMGILVYAELASWKSVRGGSWLRKATQQFAGMIQRDRHHPSVVLWGMGNEGRHRKAFNALRSLAKRLDPERPVIYAENHLYRARRAQTIGIPDVWGCNYELDVLEEGRDASRLRNVVVSECSNWPDARRGDLKAEREQVDQLALDLPRIENVPYVAGFAIWCLADYATLRKSRYLRYSGVVDAWREPKLAAFWLRARYSNVPFVKLAADWQFVAEASRGVRRVDVFTNVARAEVQVNGRTVETLVGAGHHVLELAFEPGCISAVALDVKGIFDRIASYGSAVQLALRLQSGVPDTLRIEVLDKDEHLVRDWDGQVALAVEGGAQAFPYCAGRVLVAGGCARVPVAIDVSQSPCVWRVSSSNLQPATLSISDPTLLLSSP